MQGLSKTSLELILRYVPPRDALALRATCTHLNQLIINYQRYWYFQCQRKVKRVHFESKGPRCFYNSYGIVDEIHYPYRCILDSVPFKEEMQECYKRVASDPRYRNNRNSIARTVIHEFYHRIPDRLCIHAHHFIETPLLFGDETMVDTAEFNAVKDAQTHGHQIYHFLFDSYRRTKQRVKRTKAHKVDYMLKELTRRKIKVEKKIRHLERELQFYNEYEDSKRKLEGNRVFDRKQVKSYGQVGKRRKKRNKQ